MPEPRQVAETCDRLYRAAAAHRAGSAVVDVPRGWARLAPGHDEEQFASTALNRVHWLTLDAPLGRDDVAGADAVLRASGVRRAFLWLSPAAASGAAGSHLGAFGAVRVPYVRYLALAKPVGPVGKVEKVGPVAGGPFAVRRLAGEEVAEVLGVVSPWFGARGVPAAVSMARAGLAEFFAAFEGPLTVAVGGLLIDRHGATPHGYLGWTGTDPAHRRRGAQSALIAARLERSGELGIDWCVSETNSVVETSLRNLERAGFAEAAEWAVYRWDA
ncbi:MAG: GNAT family N-acetyltransferase [Phycisphaerales bacterium]|nr:GNAT family N-acetyltransferase [Phycisphaerales bacterium]